MTAAPIPVLINRSGGTAASMGERLGPAIEAAFVAAGLRIDLQLVDGHGMQDAVRAAIGAPVIVLSGLYIVWREHVRRREETVQVMAQGVV